MTDVTVAVRMEGVTKTYSTDTVQTYAIRDLDLEIAAGEYVAITGPSGCGKSTLLSLIGLLDTLSAGKYYLQGQDTTNLSMTERARWRNRRIGFVFQSYNLIPEMNVSANLGLPVLYRGSAQEVRAREVERVLESIGMQHRAQHFPGQLSGGQQQRVAVGRAIIGHPALLLADEPTGNLDSQSGLEIIGLLEGLNREGTTLCMVTHDKDLAARAHRVIELRDGMLLRDGDGWRPDLQPLERE